ncbi:MAG TPA: hypothetical protein VI168_09915 [Croceibacterium sp.]
MLALLAPLLFAAQAAPVQPAPCTEAESVRTTVVEIGRDPERFLDQCVTVTGAVSGIFMFSGQEGMYLAYRYGREGNPDGEARMHRIGIDRQDIRNLRMTYPQETTVTGRVDSCERRAERIRAAGGIPFLGGYCHYADGPTIVVDRYSITEKRYERMTGEAARARYGNLALMPEDWPTRDQAEAAVAEFLTALRAGDRAAMAELHEAPDEPNEHYDSLLYGLLQDTYSPFLQARKGEGGQVAYFVLAGADGTLFGREYAKPTGYACFCRTADCTDRWPISSNDANNAWDRPYACTHIELRDYRPDPVFSTPVGDGWLVEPAATAMPWPTG